MKEILNRKKFLENGKRKKKNYWENKVTGEKKEKNEKKIYSLVIALTMTMINDDNRRSMVVATVTIDNN